MFPFYKRWEYVVEHYYIILKHTFQVKMKGPLIQQNKNEWMQQNEWI